VCGLTEKVSFRFLKIIIRKSFPVEDNSTPAKELAMAKSFRKALL
jgi:hypothetical protein